MKTFNGFGQIGIVAGFIGWILFFIIYTMVPVSSTGLQTLYQFGSLVLFIDIILIGQNIGQNSQWRSRPKIETIKGENVCPDCGSGNTIKRGFRNARQQRHCKECGRYFKEKTTWRPCSTPQNIGR